MGSFVPTFFDVDRPQSTAITVWLQYHGDDDQYRLITTVEHEGRRTTAECRFDLLAGQSPSAIAEAARILVEHWIYNPRPHARRINTSALGTVGLSKRRPEEKR